ncbi:hypothetical protein Tsubulata_025474 [Turnera subulata]|uniref:Transcription factor CBF/NF-Y/archaeal histone domain-containing protein n=1 Tax=Turnera subulata TaxID=218843 RepID=A0A9Q0JN49_9ROSI|nr:hypothetical protein Tsubulata_025474 [Turnera subulata]
MASTKKSKEELAKHEKKKKKKKESSKQIKDTKPPTKKKVVKTPEKSKKNATSNGKHRPEHDVVLVVPSTSSSEEEEEEDGDVQFVREVDLKRASTVADKREDKASNAKKKRTKERAAADEDSDAGEDSTTCRFPMARVKRIMKSDGCSDLLLSNDAVFLVNKAVEKFLERFSEDGFKCSVRDRKKSLGYKHLATVVSKQSRFDFLSDYVPEKIKAEDALAERRAADTG